MFAIILLFLVGCLLFSSGLLLMFDYMKYDKNGAVMITILLLSGLLMLLYTANI